MTVNEFAKVLELEQLNIADGDRKINGAYAGDLLSWVMGRTAGDNVWVTIMTNLNICAVASLADVACIVIADNAEVMKEVTDTAKNKNINLLRSPLPMYELCVNINKVI
ncbi:MAG: hypothetical protein A2Y17_08295 [Clostridiales bacterium GWF2_38_85]|nr:MAG: hypothetical protein A2Y17_08295 [Clostridiales bacterium GWF2_38_85]HBL83807.1 hypothetical protein [Clostridiales bacterium]